MLLYATYAGFGFAFDLLPQHAVTRPHTQHTQLFAAQRTHYIHTYTHQDVHKNMAGRRPQKKVQHITVLHLSLLSACHTLTLC